QYGGPREPVGGERHEADDEQRGPDDLAAVHDPTSAPTSGASTRTLVPWPGALSTSRLPPRAATRSCIVVRPRCPGFAVAGSKPTPSSLTTITTRPSAVRRLAVTRLARACFATLWRASCTTRSSSCLAANGRSGSSPSSASV